MDDAVNRIETVIKNLLNYARHEEAVFVKVNLEELIENSLLLLAYTLEKNEISVIREIRPDLNKVLGSVTHIEQIIINLIINAIDAIQQAGSLSKRKIFISAENFDNYVKFVIEDDGIGISSDKLKYIFNPFYTTKAAGKGTGLGLSVIQNIVNLHNGKIEVTSKEKKGSKFIVYLPIYKKV
jgi:two-component system NtrC family sensor kinase